MGGSYTSIGCSSAALHILHSYPHFFKEVTHLNWNLDVLNSYVSKFQKSIKAEDSLQGVHMYNIIYVSGNILIILITLVNTVKLNIYERVQ